MFVNVLLNISFKLVKISLIQNPEQILHVTSTLILKAVNSSYNYFSSS